MFDFKTDPDVADDAVSVLIMSHCFDITGRAIVARLKHVCGLIVSMIQVVRIPEFGCVWKSAVKKVADCLLPICYGAASCLPYSGNLYLEQAAHLDNRQPSHFCWHAPSQVSFISDMHSTSGTAIGFKQANASTAGQSMYVP